MSTTSSVIRVAIASKNPVKIKAAEDAFSAVFKVAVETVSVDAPSGVPDQPMSQQETLEGAQNRVEHLLSLAEEESLQADYFIAYEGGVDVFEDGPKTFAIMCISNGSESIFGQSATLPIPLKVYEKLLTGVELGTAMDELFNTVNIKQKGGAIGQLTNGLETRGSIYKSASILALSRFMNKALYE